MKNNDATERCHILDDLFNGGKKRTLKEILERVSEIRDKEYLVSTFKTDIKFMREGRYAAPIVQKRIGREHFYYYDDKTYSIRNTTHNREDLIRLHEINNILRQFKHFGIHQELEKMIEKVKNAIRQNTPIIEDIIHFEETPNYTGTIHLQPLYDIIFQKQVLNITYTPFGEDTENYVFHPQLLKQYKMRWFLIGFRGNIIDDYKKLRALPLDRINKFEINEEISHQYVPRETIIKLTEATVGVVPPWGDKAVIEEVIIKIEKTRAYYVQTKPLHSSQTIIAEDDKSITFALQVIVSRELKTNLLQYGKEFTVIKPESLRKELKEILETALEKHK